MITYNVALNIIFGYSSVSQPLFIYVPFSVDEIIVLDSMYGDDSYTSDSSEYTLQSELFDNTVVPLTMIDESNQGAVFSKHDAFTVQLKNKQFINGLYTFRINALTSGGSVENYYILLQFVNNDGINIFS